MNDVSKGGRGKIAPYETTHCRIPKPIKPLVERLTNAYKTIINDGGFNLDEQKLIDEVDKAISKTTYSEIEKPVNGYSELEELRKYKAEVSRIISTWQQESKSRKPKLSRWDKARKLLAELDRFSS